MKSVGVPEGVAAYIAIAVVLIVGGWCRFQINARRFRRRTIGGAQRFPSYGAAVFTQFWEGLVMSVANLAIVAAVLVGAGLAFWVARYR